MADSARNGKSTDVVTWGGMTQVELNTYLNCTETDTLESRLFRKIELARRPNPAKSSRIARRKPRLIHVGDQTYPIKKSKSYGVRFAHKCIETRAKRLLTDVPSFYEDFQDLYAKTRFAFGATVSPLLNRILEQGCGCGMDVSFELVNGDLDVLFSDAEEELSLFSRLICSHKITKGKDLAGWPGLRRLHSKLRAFTGKGFLHFLTCLVYLIHSVRPFSDDVGGVLITYLILLEDVFSNIVKRPPASDDPFSGELGSFSCRGFALLVPRYSNRKSFMQAVSVGFLDTSWLSEELFVDDPTLITKLVSAGFTIITNFNAWHLEFDQWNVPMVYLRTYRVVNGAEVLLNDHRFDDAKRKYLLEKGTLRDKPRPPGFNYVGIEKCAMVLNVSTTQSTLHGYSMFLDSLLWK